jgi:hypothetical protein
VVGAVVAPVLAAIGALLALIKECTIEVERTRADTLPKNLEAPVAVGAVDEQC